MSGESDAGARRLKIMGHRGAREVAPENTLAAYGLAIETGADAIELDVQLSKDGELAIMHDARLERTTDGQGQLRDYTLAELKTLNAAANHSGRDYGVQRIPTLQEAYDFVQGRLQINIEIKTGADGNRYDGIEQKVVELVRRNNAVDYTVISSFNFPSLHAVRALAPEIQLYGIVSHEFFTLKGSTEAAVLATEIAQNGFDWVAVNKAYLSAAMVETLRSQGIKAHGWVVNEVSEMWDIFDMGVDYITTDRPDVLIPAYRQGRAAQAS